MLIILDSSMLMLPMEKKINLSIEISRLVTKTHKIVVPKIVLDELTSLLDSASTITTSKANFALSLAKSFPVLESQIDMHPDAELIRLAQENEAVVATNDKILRKKLLDKGIAVISLHGKNRLSLFGHID